MSLSACMTHLSQAVADARLAEELHPGQRQNAAVLTAALTAYVLRLEAGGGDPGVVAAQKKEAAEMQKRMGVTVYKDEGHVEAALAMFEKAVELDPTLAAAHNNRGQMLFKLGLAGDAAESFQAALSLATAQGDEALANKARRLLSVAEK